MGGFFLLFVFVSLSEFCHECDEWKISRTTFDLRKTRDAKYSNQDLIVANLQESSVANIFDSLLSLVFDTGNNILE